MLTGFGNHHESEAISGALPIGQNSPQICPFNLYAEQISGTAFTQPRHLNQRSWLYRLKPSVGHEDFQPYTGNDKLSADKLINIPNQMRWSPFEIPVENKTFVDGLMLVASAGSPSMRNGLNVHIYAFNSDMKEKEAAMYNSDGDFLIVPQMGPLEIKTEFGVLQVEINEICVIPRGVVFQINRSESTGPARGYILEIFSGHFELPDLGPIGANGLANPQDFQYPSAAFDREDCEKPWRIINKYGNQLFVAKRTGSPFNVVAWRGNYAPYKYDLSRFNTINSVSWDHPDPSIFTVLTCKSASGPLADFAIFPPRWQVSEHTFRPPYFHRNAMSEFMGLIYGDYEAKQDGGFQPGGASLHSLMTPHGPDSKTFLSATKDADKPQQPKRVADGTMAFMFETSLILGIAPWALSTAQSDYCASAWSNFPNPDINK